MGLMLIKSILIRAHPDIPNIYTFRKNILKFEEKNYVAKDL
jgi:hypothetical protein